MRSVLDGLDLFINAKRTDRQALTSTLAGWLVVKNISRSEC